MAVEVSVLVISWPPVKMEGHPSVDCDSELQVVIAGSEDDTEPAPHGTKGMSWREMEDQIFCCVL